MFLKVVFKSIFKYHENVNSLKYNSQEINLLFSTMLLDLDEGAVQSYVMSFILGLALKSCFQVFKKLYHGKPADICMKVVLLLILTFEKNNFRFRILFVNLSFERSKSSK